MSLYRYTYCVTGYVTDVGGFSLWVAATNEQDAMRQTRDAIPAAEIDFAELEASEPVDDLG